MGRILELDALRGIAALIIVLAHIGLLPGTPWVLSMVDLFFVISGYFITTNILKNRTSSHFLSVFFIRRALRIWPAYYLALTACLILNRSLKWDFRPDAWPYYFTFTQNVQAYLGWPIPRFSGMFLHTWTLAIEEQFYLIWPLLIYRTNRRGMFAIAIGFTLLSPLLRSFGYLPSLLLTRADGLALGSLLALILDKKSLARREILTYRLAFATVSVLAILSPAIVPGLSSGRYADVLFTTRSGMTYFGLTGLVLCMIEHPWLIVLRGRVLCYVGTVSYGVYLYHPLVFAALPTLYKRYVMRKLGLRSTLLMDLVMFVVCFMLAEVSRRWVEGPILRLKDRLRFKEEASGNIYRGPHVNSSPSVSTIESSAATEAG